MRNTAVLRLVVYGTVSKTALYPRKSLMPAAPFHPNLEGRARRPLHTATFSGSFSENLSSLLLGGGPLYPLPRGARFPRLRQFGVGLGVAGRGAQAFTGLARVDLEFVTDGLERHDVGHFDLLSC